MAIWKPWIVCDGAPELGSTLPECSFASLITLVEVLIYNMVVLSTLIATAVFAYIGFILLTSGGKPGAREKAIGMFMKVVKGYLWILFAWLVVYTITSTLLNDGYTLLKS